MDEAIVALEDVLIRYPGTEDSEVTIRRVGEVFTAGVDSETHRHELKTIRLIKPDRDEWHVEGQTFRLVPFCGLSYQRLLLFTYSPCSSFNYSCTAEILV